MGKIIEWKKESEVRSEEIKDSEDIEDIENIEEDEKDSLAVIHQFVESYYRDEKQGEGEIDPYEINGFEIGLISYLNLLEQGLLPYVIKNINVLAVKKFERITKLYPEVDIPQEFYSGFLKGFCSIYKKYM